MGSKTVYNPPKIEKDDSFAKYLEYQKERETRLDERAQKEREDEAARELTRRKSGAKGLTALNMGAMAAQNRVLESNPTKQTIAGKYFR